MCSVAQRASTLIQEFLSDGCFKSLHIRVTGQCIQLWHKTHYCLLLVECFHNLMIAHPRGVVYEFLQLLGSSIQSLNFESCYRFLCKFYTQTLYCFFITKEKMTKLDSWKYNSVWKESSAWKFNLVRTFTCCSISRTL